MEWTSLEKEEQLDQLVQSSSNQPQVIFKHSTRCIISSLAKDRIEKYNHSDLDFHYLDLIKYRQLSNLIADKFNVYHQSPQVLIIKNGECVFDESYGGINIQDFDAFKN